jgi:hypothetical protein
MNQGNINNHITLKYIPHENNLNHCKKKMVNAIKLHLCIDISKHKVVTKTATNHLKTKSYDAKQFLD